MRVDMRPRFKLKETIVAKGYDNQLTIPYRGRSFEKTFDKGSIVVGQKRTISNDKGDEQTIFSVIEAEAKNTIDRSTKEPYTGRVEFALDPTKVEMIQMYVQTDPMSEPTKSSAPSTSKLFGAYNKNLILVVLAVAGYFAYKKLKK